MADILVLSERITNIIQLGESQFREFKSAYFGPPENKKPRNIDSICKDIAEALVAFANADGGDILIGVEDNGTITGIPFSPDNIQSMIRKSRALIKNGKTIPIQTATSLTYDEKTILLFSVEKGSSEVYQLVDGRCLRRYGVNTNPELIQRIEFDRTEILSRSYDSEFIDGANVTDLNIDQLIDATDKYIKGISSEKYLQQLGLAEYTTGGLRLRRAALLLFSKDILRWHARCQVRIIKVHGNVLKNGSEYNVVSDEFVQGNIFDLVEKSWERLRPFLAYRTQLNVDVRFSQQYIYPEWACIEALTNAIAHRSYLIQNAIEIYIFDERMEIKSPGSILSTINIEKLRTLNNVHESRNPLISRCLREYGYMRELGEGMKRIFRSMEDNDLDAPELKSDDTSFTVTLYNKSVYNEQQLAWLEFFAQFNPSRLQKRILVAGMNSRELAPADIYQAMNTTDRDTYDREVTELRIAGILLEIRTSVQATAMRERTGQEKRLIPRFVVKDLSKEENERMNKIVVFNIPKDAKRYEIINLFEEYGTIKDIYLQPRRKAISGTQFAILTFAEPGSVSKLLNLNQQRVLKGNKLRIEIYRNPSM